MTSYTVDRLHYRWQDVCVFQSGWQDKGELLYHITIEALFLLPWCTACVECLLF